MKKHIPGTFNVLICLLKGSLEISVPCSQSFLFSIFLFFISIYEQYFVVSCHCKSLWRCQKSVFVGMKAARLCYYSGCSSSHSQQGALNITNDTFKQTFFQSRGFSVLNSGALASLCVQSQNKLHTNYLSRFVFVCRSVKDVLLRVHV